jgi:hypothetical protein
VCRSLSLCVYAHFLGSRARLLWCRVLILVSVARRVSQLAEGPRALIEQFALPRRPYLGTTSMDTELAFLMANQALVRPPLLTEREREGETEGSLCVSMCLRVNERGLVRAPKSR